MIEAENEAESDAENEAESGAESEAESGAESGAESDAEKLTSRQIKILELIKKDHTISREVLSTLLNVGDSSIYRDMEKLKKWEILERVGADKGGYWKIKRDV